MKPRTKLSLILTPLLLILTLGAIIPVSAVENSIDIIQSFNQRRPDVGNMKNPPMHNHPLPDDVIMNHTKLENKSEIRNRNSYFMINAAGKIPFYRWYGADNFSAYHLRIMRIIEYNDANEDGQFQQDEVVFHIQLQGNVDWSFTNEAANDTTVVFSFYSSNIRLPGFENTVFNMTNYLNREARNLKFDIEIANWPWAAPTDRLAFQFYFSSQFNDARNRNMERLNKTGQNPLDRTNEEGVYLQNDEGKVAGFFSSSPVAYASSVDGNIDVVTQMEFQKKDYSWRVQSVN
jgi:hypothetical protein